MDIKIKGLNVKKEVNLGPGASPKAKGGTELMMQWLRENVDNSLLDYFQIIPTRVRELNGKPAILWLHDLPEDPECTHLNVRENVEKFKSLVCVSQWQKERFLYYFSKTIKPEEIIVLKNAIYPINNIKKSNDQIRLIYHTTPHRGLDILYVVYDQLFKRYGSRIHLDVFSSFKIYDRELMDKEYEELYQKLREHPGITYHGTVDNKTIREYLARSHIFTYPSTWLETSCIAAIEAMSAKNCVIYPDNGALPETCGNFGAKYQYIANKREHAEMFLSVLENVLDQFLNGQVHAELLNYQKGHIDTFYGWHNRKNEWESFLNALKNKCEKNK